MIANPSPMIPAENTPSFTSFNAITSPVANAFNSVTSADLTSSADLTPSTDLTSFG